MKRTKKYISIMLTVVLLMSMLPVKPVRLEAAQSSTVLMDSSTQWKYLDDNTDPGEVGNPTAWTAPSYNDNSWKTGAGRFGAKNGARTDLDKNKTGIFIPDVLLNQYIDPAASKKQDIPAFFFRSTFTIDDLNDFSQLVGQLDYDDGAVVYINGTKVGSFSMTTTGRESSNMNYAGSGSSNPLSGKFTVTDISILKSGTNTIAVELHQSDAGSSDIYLHFKSLRIMKDGFKTIQAENFSSCSGSALTIMDTTDAGSTVQVVSGSAIGSYLGFEDMNFTETPYSLDIRYASSGVESVSGASLEIRLGSVSGSAIQTVELPATGDSWDSYTTLNVTLNNTSAYLAAEKLYFVMQGIADESRTQVANIDYFQFNKAPVVITQKAISLNVGADATKRNITWYSNDSAPGVLQIGKKSDMTGTNFPSKYTSYTANLQAANDTGFYSNQLTMSGLAYNTEYVYRLINGSVVSEIYSFRTGTEGDFSFLFAGDPQIGASGNGTTDSSGWDNTLTTALSNFPGTDFIVSAGDQVNTSSDEAQYAGFLEHSVLRSNAIATVIGNHDSGNLAYSQHFNNPNVSPKGATPAGSDYWYVYNNVLFLNLNSNNVSTAEHKAFLEEAIASNPGVDWKVVVFHHSVYSVAEHSADSDILSRRAEWVPVFQELGIDVVLMGHDHVYVRSYMMNGLTADTQRNTDNSALNEVTDPTGVLYVTANSASGSKYYQINSAGTFPFSAVQSQESKPNISNVEITKNTFKITTYRIMGTGELDMNNPVDTFEIRHSISPVKPVTMESTKVAGIKNNSAKLQMTKVAGYDSGKTSASGGCTEIVKYNSDNHSYYVVNGVTGNLDIVPREIYKQGINDATAKGISINLNMKLSGLISGFTYGDMTSVDVNTDRDIIAVGVQGAGTNDDSYLVFLSYDGKVLKAVKAGKQVDMVTFTNDGNKLLAANEGEPRDGYGSGATDPKGSVSIVDLTDGLDQASVKDVTFDRFDEKREQLVAEGVILKKNTLPSVDLEPEYIAVDKNSKYAYVSLQEANAIATLDITKGEFVAVKSLGFKDHSLEKNALDLIKDDKISIKTQNVYGMYMPDGIAVYEYMGKTYLITANEGDSREWADYKNESEITLEGKTVVTLNTSDYDGVDPAKTYIFGGRSFSIYEAGTMTQVYDSGSEFETITAAAYPKNFNCSNDKTSMDNRSGKKGPEPENVVVGNVGDSVYALIGLERIGGIIAFDITDPAKTEYVNYINSRDFSSAIAGDDSPEGLCFIPADKSYSGKAELLSAFEVSGTVGIFELVKENSGDTQVTPSPSPSPIASPSPSPIASPSPSPIVQPSPSVVPTSAPSNGNQNQGGVTPKPTVKPVPSAVPSPSAAPAPTVKIEKIVAGESSGNGGTAQVTIERTTDAKGDKTERVTLEQQSAVKAAQTLKKQGKEIVKIVIPEDAAVKKTTVQIPVNTVEILSDSKLGLGIDTENAKIDISKASLSKTGSTLAEDLYFHIAPLSDDAITEQMMDRASLQLEASGGREDGSLSIIGAPVEIETNLAASGADITLPLSGVTIPASAAKKAEFAKQLMVYIEHSNGTKEFATGKLVRLGDGTYAIKIKVTHFSVFAVVKTDAFLKSSDCSISKVSAPAKAELKGKDIKATVSDKTAAVTVKLKVSDKADWQLYSDRSCSKKLDNNKIKLKTGINRAYIKVTAEDGTTKLYCIAITKK